MGSHLRLQLLFVAVAAWLAAGLADRHALPFAEVICAVAAVVAGLLTLIPRR